MKKPDQPSLDIQFTYDHAAGVFTAHLENGATFTLDKASVSGRLQNALTLFARGVVNSEGGKWRQAPPTTKTFEYSYDESQVRKFSRSGKAKLPELTLDEIDLELEL